MLKPAVRTAPFPSIVVDAASWLRRMGLPYWALTVIRQLKEGDRLPIVDYRGPGLSEHLHGHVAVVFTREGEDTILAEAFWTMHLGANTSRRGIIWSTSRFKLLPGRRFELLPPPLASESDTRLQEFRDLAIVVRRSLALSRWARHAGDADADFELRPEFFAARLEAGSRGKYVQFLERLRAPKKPFWAAA